MFSLMGNCISCIKKRGQPKQPITLAILGLDCAGKTTTTKGITGEPIDLDEAPTVGFKSSSFVSDKFEVKLYDLGGGRKIRGIWKNYFAEVYGVIYLVDSSASNRMEEARENLKELLEHPQISGKPVLLLANKQDKEEALDELDICEQLQLEDIVNVNKCPCRIETCSALSGTGRKMDINIKDGLKWLLSLIDRDLDSLKSRVDADEKIEEEKRKLDREARRERVRLQKEERERKEAEERERLGIAKEDEEEEEKRDDDDDPFKVLSLKDLEAKEKKLKEEKRKMKELRRQQEEKENHIHGSTMLDIESCQTPRSVHAHPANLLAVESAHNCHNNNAYKPEESDEGSGGGLVVSPNSSKLRLPPLQQQEGPSPRGQGGKKKRKKKRPNGEDHEDVGQLLSESVLDKSFNSVSHVDIGTDDPDVLLDSSRVEHLDADVNNMGADVLKTDKKAKVKKKKVPSVMNSTEEAEDVMTDGSQSRIMSSLDGGSINEEGRSAITPGKKKKKRGRLKKNKLAPSDDEVEMSPIHSQRSDRSNGLLPWDTPALNAKSPGKAGIQSGFLMKNGMAKNWGLAEELPEVVEEPRRLKPNYDDDDDIVM